MSLERYKEVIKDLKRNGFVKVAEYAKAVYGDPPAVMRIEYWTNSRVPPEEITRQKIVAVFQDGRTSYVSVYGFLKLIADMLRDGEVVRREGFLAIKVKDETLAIYAK